MSGGIEWAAEQAKIDANAEVANKMRSNIKLLSKLGNSKLAEIDEKIRHELEILERQSMTRRGHLALDTLIYEIKKIIGS